MVPFIAHISGNPNIPALGRINIRAQPSTAAGVAVLFEAPVGTNNLTVLEVQNDLANNHLNGKVYQWFRLRFADGRIGWARDDLISVQGDGTLFGYPDLNQAAYAFGLMRALLPVTPTPTPPPVPVPPPPEPEPEPEPEPPPAPPPTGDLLATVISPSSLNLRNAPVNGTVIARIGFRKRVKILNAQPQGGTSNFIWVQVQAVEGVGWVRHDFLSVSGNGSRFGLSAGDEFPTPMENFWWVRGQNVNQNPGEANHKGWDFGASPGEVVRSAPTNGLVMRLMNCTRCTAEKPNVISQGIPLNSPSVLNDPAWGFGYGNAVIVRYLNNQLPASARQRLTEWGYSGMHLYVIYAHLKSISVTVGQRLEPNQQIGIIGNTGNSTGTHLHIEVHVSAKVDDIGWGALPNLDPKVAFRR